MAGRGGGDAGCEEGGDGMSFFAPVAVRLYSEWDTNPSQLRALGVIGSVLSPSASSAAAPPTDMLAYTFQIKKIAKSKLTLPIGLGMRNCQ